MTKYGYLRELIEVAVLDDLPGDEVTLLGHAGTNQSSIVTRSPVVHVNGMLLVMPCALAYVESERNVLSKHLVPDDLYNIPK